MDLLVCVVNDDSKLDELFEGLVEIGVTGATVLKSQGMGRRLADEIPALAGLQDLLARGRPDNTMLFSLVEDEEKLDEALRVVNRVYGDLDAPGTGIAFTMPVGRAVGLAPEPGARNRGAAPNTEQANSGGV